MNVRAFIEVVKLKVDKLGGKFDQFKDSSFLRTLTATNKKLNISIKQNKITQNGGQEFRWFNRDPGRQTLQVTIQNGSLELAL